MNSSRLHIIAERTIHKISVKPDVQLNMRDKIDFDITTFILTVINSN